MPPALITVPEGAFFFLFRILGDSDNTIMMNPACGDKNYESSFSGCNFVNWLSSNDITRDRYAAVILAQHFLDLLLIKAGMNLTYFRY